LLQTAKVILCGRQTSTFSVSANMLIDGKWHECFTEPQMEIFGERN
jgi:hypothetical protein